MSKKEYRKPEIKRMPIENDINILKASCTPWGGGWTACNS
jgi:hypothetical protein